MKVKVSILTIVITCLLVTSCQNEEIYRESDQDLLQAFISSSLLQNASQLDQSLINLSLSRVLYVNSDFENPIFYVALTKAEQIVGVVEGMKVPEHKRSRTFSGNDEYVISYRDYRDFDHRFQSGPIRYHDLNSGSYKGDVVFREGTLLEITNFSSNRAIPCDQNGNGNLGYGECYDCFTEACEGDAECDHLCNWADMAGILIGVGPLCDASIGVSCMYLSIAY